jgi:hypothetical protein
VMVLKIGSTDRSIVVMAKEFMSQVCVRSFQWMTRTHPKG